MDFHTTLHCFSILPKNIVTDIGAILASLVTLMWKNYKEKVTICQSPFFHHLTRNTFSITGDSTDGKVQDHEAEARVRFDYGDLKLSESRGSEEEEEQEAGFKDNLKTAGGAVAFLVAFIGFGAYFFRSLLLPIFPGLFLI